MNLYETLSEAGWRYDVASNGFYKGEDWVSFQQAEHALTAAEAGIDLSLEAAPANDDGPVGRHTDCARCAERRVDPTVTCALMLPDPFCGAMQDDEPDDAA
jgi:hypothetical protein